ncbi:PP2C family protein-serine/threonine phosphatase [Psychromarinibacter sp. C21-152]|uniref:PP2C family protein-serine/threonine phosphatase n=1 Tax=Psychromarinibacter sediminicola TaxID=3033385 RepID=A0AAE3NNN2_9RHOB|nr:PP2C family protein-serine/threonine phosphatase [Psychromarinibacter sediminicola]MDF0601323.1 PP2C family protein-serine/threonine phosphatase [Psychromarinibacter sediminicola]
MSLLLRPAGRVGGDLVGMFEVNAREIGVFALDVSGHGIASALMTARLAAHFAGTTPGTNIAITRDRDGQPVMRNPSAAVARLNDIVLNQMETEQYLTLILARIALDDGRVTLTQAGHPHPMIHRADGAVESAGDGGMPVGLLPAAGFSDTELQLRPGDRILIGSDGITECMSPGHEMFDDAGLRAFLRDHAMSRGQALFDRLIDRLAGHMGHSDFADDVSAILLDFS